MRHGTHELLGLCAGLAAARAGELPATQGTMLCATAVAASCLPDVDQPGSRIHRHTWLERRVRTASVLGLIARAPFVVYAAIAGHRGATHWASTGIVLSGAIAVLGAVNGAQSTSLIAAGVAIGYGGHLCADACTPSGVPLFGPFSSRRIHLLPAGWRIPTGSLRESAVAAATAVVAAVLVFA